MSYRAYTYLTDLILVLQNLLLYFGYRSTRRYYRYNSTRRYYWTYTQSTDTGVPIGTTELIQIQDLSDTGVPVGTTEQIRYGQNLINCRSTRRYYRTDQIQDRTYSDTRLIRCRSTRRYYRTYTDTVGIRYRSTRRYYRTYTETELIRYRSTRRYCRTDQIQDLSDTGVPVGTTELI